MYKSIQHFVQKVIPQIEKSEKNFMEAPTTLWECIAQVKQEMLAFGCEIVAEMIEECSQMLEESGRRRKNWQIKDRGEKSLLTNIGMIVYPHTRFENKGTGETSYLVDQLMGIGPHRRLGKDVEERILIEVAQSSYRKAGEILEGEDVISKESVMRHVHKLRIPAANGQEVKEKRKVKELYVEADEDHIALQFHKKKGDVKRYESHGDNHQIVKLVYVHEGYEEEGKRKKLKHVVYFGGIYAGKENDKLWEKVKEYIEKTYDAEVLEKIYFQSDGGSWMKKGVEVLGAEFVLDEFHLKKYVKKLSRLLGEEENEEKIMEYLKKEERKKLEEWVREKSEEVEEKKRKKVEECMRYLRKNWKGIRNRIKKGMLGSSTESHISHILSARMSSRPMGWSEEGADKQAQLRIYWKNGGKIKELFEGYGKEEEKKEEISCFSASEMTSWERKHQKNNGKYVEAMQASVSQQAIKKIYFQKVLVGICG